MYVAIALSFLSGVCVVLSRTINARFAKETSEITSTFYNFFVGLLLSLIICLLLGRQELTVFPKQISSEPVMYLGGVLGVISVFLLNVTVTKISSFYMTLFMFVGQLFTGILLDAVLTHSFSAKQMIGGIFVALGLSLNMYFDKSPDKETATP